MYVNILEASQRYSETHAKRARKLDNLAKFLVNIHVQGPRSIVIKLPLLSPDERRRLRSWYMTQRVANYTLAVNKPKDEDKGKGERELSDLKDV